MTFLDPLGEQASRPNPSDEVIAAMRELNPDYEPIITEAPPLPSTQEEFDAAVKASFG